MMIAIIIIEIIFILGIFLLICLLPKEEVFIIDKVSYTKAELFDIADGLNPRWEVKSRKEVEDKDGVVLVSCVVINKKTKKEAVVKIRKEMGINTEIINKSGWIK